MPNTSRTNKELIEENSIFKQRIQELEQSESARKRAEEALRESEERFRKIFEEAYLVGIVISSPSLAFAKANPTFCRMMGYSADELRSMTFADITHPDHLNQDVENVKKVGRGEMPFYQIEKRYINKSGKVLWGNLIVSSIRDEHGALRYYLAIVIDITERKRAEQEMAILSAIGWLISSTLDINEVYERFAAEVRKLIPFDRIHVNLKNPDGESLTIAYVSGFDIAGRRPGDKVPLAGSISEVIIRTRIGLCFHPASVEEIVGRFPSASAATTFRAGMRSIIAVPLISRNEVIGTLHFRAKKPNAYTEQDLRLAERIGSQIAGAVANAQLYSDLKETEKSLRKSEDRYRTLFNEARDGIALADLETGKILDCNQALCDMVERTKEELIGQSQSILHPQQTLVDGHSVSYRMHSSENPELVMEDSLLSKNGKQMPVEIRAAQASIEGWHCLFGTFRDITERKQAEEALRKSEKKFRELVEHINDVFYELDKQGIIQYASPSVEYLFGYCQAETIGRSIIDFLDPEGKVSAIENIQNVMVGHIAPHEYRVRCKSGEIRWVRVFSSPIRKGDQVVGIRGVLSNITERKQAEKVLKETLDELESRVRERTLELEETNTALRVLLKKGDKDQKTLEESLQSNINQLVTPFLSKLKVSQSNPERQTYLNILETNLSNIVSPFINRLSAAYKNLTPKEIQIAELIKQGKRSKEIAELFGISVGTVHTHRNKIRKKLDLKSKDANLRSHLLSLA